MYIISYKVFSLFQLLRNKLMSKRKKNSRLGYLPVQSGQLELWNRLPTCSDMLARTLDQATYPSRQVSQNSGLGYLPAQTGQLELWTRLPTRSDRLARTLDQATYLFRQVSQNSRLGYLPVQENMVELLFLICRLLLLQKN